MVSKLSKNNKGYYPALDGLRGLAVLLVVLYHNFEYTSYFFFGWMGVDIFFVLSGFLITQIILKTVNDPYFLRNFYIRRMLRIFPVYYLVLFVCLIIFPAFHVGNFNLSYFTGNQVWLWTFCQNWLFIFKKPHGTILLLHLWSLAVEEQFYLFWPLTVLLIRKPKILLVISITLLMVVNVMRFILWRAQIQDINYFYLYTFTRIDGLCIGCMVALCMAINPLLIKKYTLATLLFFNVLNYAFYFINKKSFFLPYLPILGYTTFAFLFGYLVYKALSGTSVIIEFLFNNRLMRFIGKISYGLYLFHWPIFLLLFRVITQMIMRYLSLRENIADKLSSLVVAFIAVMVSYLSYKYFETYFLKLKDRFSGQRHLSS